MEDQAIFGTVCRNTMALIHAPDARALNHSTYKEVKNLHENVSMIQPAPIDPVSVIVKPSGEIASLDQTENVVGFQQILVQKVQAENSDLVKDDSEPETEVVTGETIAQLSVHPEWTENTMPETPTRIPVIGSFQLPLNPESVLSDSQAQTVFLNINSIRVPEIPGEQPVLASNPIKSIYSPIEITGKQSGEGTGSNAIYSPIAFRVDGGYNPSAGLISGDVSIPEKIPVEGHSPPGQSNSPPEKAEWNVTAGPRGNDLTIPGSIRSYEEANPRETHRVVSNRRSPNLMREYFRVPVNEITKGTVSHREDSVFLTTDVPNRPELKERTDFRTPLHDRTDTRSTKQASRIEFSDRQVDKSTPIEQPNSKVERPVSPILTSNTEVKSENRLNTSPNPGIVAKPPINPETDVAARSIPDTRSISTESQNLSDFKIHVNVQENGEVKSSSINVQSQQSLNLNAVEKPVSENNFSNQGDSTSDRNQSNVQQSSTEPAKDASQTSTEFKFKTVEQQVGSIQNSSGNNQVQQTPGSTVVASSVNGGTLAGNSNVPDQVVELKEPISILGNAPARIASEIAEFSTEELPNGQKAVLKVELNPPRLGRMNIELVKTETGIEVKLVVRTHFARELISHRGDEIRSALQESGIDIKKLEIVDLNQDRQDFNRQQNGLFSGDTGYKKGSDEAHQGSANNQEVRIDDEEIEMESEYVAFADRRLSSANQNVLDILA